MKLKNIKLRIQKVGTAELIYSTSKTEDYLSLFPHDLHIETVLEVNNIVYQSEHISIKNMLEDGALTMEIIVEADVVEGCDILD